uniref:Uncharacterized protein n=1 Tax=Arundo donax TaxID=35708 RepID=A0A0A8Y6K4_ARUDO
MASSSDAVLMHSRHFRMTPQHFSHWRGCSSSFPWFECGVCNLWCFYLIVCKCAQED